MSLASGAPATWGRNNSARADPPRAFYLVASGIAIVGEPCCLGGGEAMGRRAGADAVMGWRVRGGTPFAKPQAWARPRSGGPVGKERRGPMKRSQPC